LTKLSVWQWQTLQLKCCHDEKKITAPTAGLTFLPTATARSGSQVPIWRTRWPLSRSLIRRTRVSSLLKIVPSITLHVHAFKMLSENPWNHIVPKG